MAVTKKEKNRRIKLLIEECNRIISYFGLYEWRVYFQYDEQIKEYTAYCEVYTPKSNAESDHQLAGIFYSTDWIMDEDTKDEDILATAFHEIMELLLMKLRRFAENTSLVISEREIDTEIHRIIRIFENRIYKRGLV